MTADGMAAGRASAGRASAGRACPGCGSRSRSPFAAENIDRSRVTAFTYASRKAPEYMCLELVCCEDCDLVYAPYPPDPDFLSTSYAEAAYDSSEEARCAADSYIRALRPRLRALPSRHAAVDVGAGSGPLLPLLRQAGFSAVVGIEPSRAAIEAAADEVRPMLREGMFTPQMLEGLEPTLICSFMTLEHLDEPGEFARTAHALLAPGGMVAVVVHNRRGLLNRLMGMKSPIIDVEHLQLFSPASITALLKNAGFTEIQVSPIWNSYPLRYWLRLAPLPAPLRKALLWFAQKSGLAGLKIAAPVGNMLATARKRSMESA